MLKTERYEEPVQLLEEEYLSRKEKNPSYSISAFARDLGVSVGQLSRLFNRTRPLTHRQASRFAASLNLSKGITESWIQSTILSASPKAKVSSGLREVARQTRRKDPVSLSDLSVERFKVISQWHHLAILNLIHLKDFESSPKWIAGRLGISSIEASSALKRLFDLELIEKCPKGTLKRTEAHYYIHPKKSEPEVRRFHRSMIQKSLIELDETSLQAYQARLINSITFPLNQKNLEQLKSMIIEFQKTILNSNSKSKKNHTYDSVYQLNCQLFPLTSTPKKENQS